MSLTLAHQHFAQLQPEIRDAMLGNVGSLVTFRVGTADAELLEPEFAPTFAAEDLARLPNHEIYVRLMVKGSVAAPSAAERSCSRCEILCATSLDNAFGLQRDRRRAGVAPASSASCRRRHSNPLSGGGTVAVKTDILAHWYTLLGDMQASGLEFYKSVEANVAKRQVPDAKSSRVEFKEGGVLTAKREYCA